MGPSRREWVYYGLVYSLGGVLWGWALSRMLVQTWNSTSLWVLAGLAALTLVTLFRDVRLSNEDYHSVYTLDDVPLYALIFLQGWEAAVVVAGVARLICELVRLGRALRSHPERVHWAHVIFHFGDVPASINVAGIAGLVYGQVAGGAALLESPRSLGAVALATSAWFLLAFGQNSLVVTLRRQLPVSWMLQVFAKNFRHIRLHVLMLVPLGALLALFLQHYPWLALLLLVPVSLMHTALDAQHKLKLESTSTIEALAHYLEERDPYTQGHSARVSAYAVEIAQAMRLNEDEVEQVRRAGLIHDIGKVDIPDSILRKPGNLNELERKIMDTHTQRAVDLGRQLVSLRRELPFREAAYHHENYDGTGQYRLVGDQIPLVSRILAVADTFDAMTSDRPYRVALSFEQALERLRRAAGSQLDPRCVEAFEKALENGAIQRISSAQASGSAPGCQA